MASRRENASLYGRSRVLVLFGMVIVLSGLVSFLSSPDGRLSLLFWGVAGNTVMLFGILARRSRRFGAVGAFFSLLVAGASLRQLYSLLGSNPEGGAHIHAAMAVLALFASLASAFVFYRVGKEGS
jgi:hypothetical protein